MVLALLGLALGAALGLGLYAIVRADDKVAQLGRQICAHQRSDRIIDQELASAGHIPVAVPTFGPGECP